jgi:PTH1 family peptidyl-tRNA hydrolase
MSRDGDRPRRVVLGLGNPGERYDDTRHNVGFRVAEAVARRRRIALSESECNAVVGGDERVLVALPQTFMNRSGFTARCLAERHGFAPEDFLVVYDEVHLPLGKLRLRGRGSPAGHRGMESILENLGSEAVPRLRLGVVGEDGLPEGGELTDYVLSPFPSAEQEAVDEMVERAAQACETWLEDGLETAMQRWNG